MKKNSNKKVMRNMAELPMCFVKVNDKYVLHAKMEERLPVVPIKHLWVLEKLAISHRKVTLESGIEAVEYWNKDVYKEEEVKLPVYMYMFGEYRNVEKHTDIIPTKETCEKAHELVNLVEETLKNGEIAGRAIWLKEYVGKEDAVYLSRKLAEYKFEKEEKISCKDTTFHLFVIKNAKGNPTDHVLVFDLEKIKNKKYVNINIPEEYREYIPYIIGNGGCNLKKIVAELGIKKINIL